MSCNLLRSCMGLSVIPKRMILSHGPSCKITTVKPSPFSTPKSSAVQFCHKFSIRACKLFIGSSKIINLRNKRSAILYRYIIPFFRKAKSKNLKGLWVNMERFRCQKSALRDPEKSIMILVAMTKYRKSPGKFTKLSLKWLLRIVQIATRISQPSRSY